MSPIAQLLVQIVTDAGGKLDYPAVKAAVPPEHWREIPFAFKEAKANGALSQEVAWVNGANVHSYLIPTGGS